MTPTTHAKAPRINDPISSAIMVLTECNRCVGSQIRASIGIEIAHECWLEDVDDQHGNLLHVNGVIPLFEIHESFFNGKVVDPLTIGEKYFEHR